MIIEKEDLLEYHVEIAKAIRGYMDEKYRVEIEDIFLSQESSSSYIFKIKYFSNGVRILNHSSYNTNTKDLIIHDLLDNQNHSYVADTEKLILSAIKTTKRDKIINELV